MSTVERDAIGFKYGSHPAKKFFCSVADFLKSNGTSGTVPLGLNPLTKNHYQGEPNILDGETGTASFAVDEANPLLPLKLNIPAWVNDLVTKHNLKLSAVFNNPTEKKLLKFDFVDRPHIKEAVLLSENVVVFSDDDVEAESETEVEFCDEGKQELADRMHEMIAAKYPRMCSPGVKFADESGAMLHIQLMHDMAVHEGAACDGMHENPERTPKTKGKVTMSDEMDIEDTAAQDAVAFSEGRVDDIQNPTTRMLAQRVRDAETKQHRTDEDRRKDKAVVFSDSKTRGDDATLTPAQGKAAFLLHKVLAKLDADATGAVTFSDRDDKPVADKTHVALLGDLLDGLRPLKLKSERVDGNVTLSSEPNEDEVKKVAAKRQAEREENQAWAKARNSK